MLDDIEVRYDECQACHSLQVPEPTWLEQAYALRVVPDPDQGALKRSLFLHRCIQRLCSSPSRWIPRRARVLDFGSGRGFLLRLLLDSSHEAWGYDPYPGAVLAEDRVLRELPRTPQQLIVMSEVIEHLTDPDPVLAGLSALLAEDGVLLISTELYETGRHDVQWHYLAPEHGQHIEFYSQAGLDGLLARHGLCRVTTLRMDGIDFVHLYVPSARRLAPGAVTVQRLRHRLAEGSV